MVFNLDINCVLVNTRTRLVSMNFKDTENLNGNIKILDPIIKCDQNSNNNKNYFANSIIYVLACFILFHKVVAYFSEDLIIEYT